MTCYHVNGKFLPIEGQKGQLQVEVGYMYRYNYYYYYYYYYYFLLASTLFLLRRYVCNCYPYIPAGTGSFQCKYTTRQRGMLILSFLRKHKITCHMEELSFSPSVCLSNSELVSETTPFSGFSKYIRHESLKQVVERGRVS